MIYRSTPPRGQLKDVPPPIRVAKSFLGVTVAWALLAFVKSSNTGDAVLFYVFFVFYGGFFWMAAWLYFLVLGLIRLGRTAYLNKFVTFAVAELLIFGFGQWAAHSDVPFKARFALSRTALEHYATSLPTGHADRSSKHVGLFVVQETEHLMNCVRMITGTAGFADDAGLVYCPEGQPPRIGEDGYRHLTGPWWHWHRSW